uniref:WW domain-containing protein n=3 Tax=Tetraselmis sp. GSL018 TaxID=582737 RepID=A0A061RNP9_9CHLO|eukprot:CAMPEP_0177589376 /NCGR_PEP_ID=MMETSP0419_2-20121207/6768_1 /TAXON_ID=582737 /ORGANISM="Tetraselmis sp., Strain GSL018" /LENGTH=409 /DNA_ID=CAMNT_0019079721 /DNA_START=114 /DNA_END=1343 /DNA_ORIENTATION=+
MPSASKKQEGFLQIAEELGLNPALDFELFWIAQEYLNAQLPEGWVAVTQDDNSIRYISESLRVNVRENPILPRYKRLVSIMLRWKERDEPPDEMTVLELLDPIERVMDVKEMAEYMGINPVKEPHLLWLAKLNVLEALPPGWQEQELADGTIIYLNIEEGYSSDEHPNDKLFKDLLERERKKDMPYRSIQPQYFEWPVIHYKNDIDEDGDVVRTPVIPNCGTYIDFYDIYGRHFWYDIVTDHVTLDVREVRYIPAVVTLQRIWRGYVTRRQISELDRIVRRIVAWWKTSRFRKAVRDAEQQRLNAVLVIQKAFHDKQVQIQESRLLYRRLGMVGSRPGKPIRRRISGIMSTCYSFPCVRRRVIFLQRLCREWLARRREKERRMLADANEERMRLKREKLTSYKLLRVGR